MFEAKEIYSDKYIQDIYNQIEEREKNDFATHGRKHMYKVTEIIETILEQLGYSQEIIECGKIAALLHDLGCREGKDEHEIRSYNIAKEYLQGKDLTQEQKQYILNAILNHRNSIENKEILDKALVLADKLDYTKNRINSEGLKVENFNQLQYINDIQIDITENDFIVRFIVEEEFDKTLLEKYYFTPKVFRAIQDFSKYIQKNAVVLLNDKIWNFNID